MKETWIGLLDCNNFFVSCERLFRPDLKNVPVVVLSSNDGCVVARSQEIKDMNVPMGVPYFQIKDILKTSNAKVFSGNHALYRDISKRVFKVLEADNPGMDQYSVDEAFFPLMGEPEAALDQARVIKDNIEKQVGIPVSVGVAKSRTLAKVANSIAKKGSGTYVLTMEDWRARRKEVGVEQVWGIGAGFSRRLRSHDIQTADDFVQADTVRIRALFGVVGQRLQSELQGVSTYQRNEKPKQSIMSSRSFVAETTDLQVMKDAVAHHIEQLGYELRQMRHKTKALAVYIAPSRHGDFALYNRSKEIVFELGEDSTTVLTKAAFVLLEDIFEVDVPYKKAGVRIGALESNLEGQLQLFADTKEGGRDALQEAIDSIHSKYETGRVHIGRLERSALYHGKAEKKSPRYTTNWQELKAVKAN